MILEIQSAQQDIFGIYELKVLVNDKPYTYELNSSYAYDKVIRFYRAGRHGRALNELKKGMQ